MGGNLTIVISGCQNMCSTIGDYNHYSIAGFIPSLLSEKETMFVSQSMALFFSFSLSSPVAALRNANNNNNNNNNDNNNDNNNNNHHHHHNDNNNNNDNNSNKY